ncbi:hypothetical protein SHKM778_96080 (plasmid) [Streptomyces sp. KM77-8]|uniref:Uncharacterized protein n=1 Tax=Streptomyces haneummycinicus TaxID=3074435 RepID=A0AAT9I0K5_9ACTN
MVVRETTAETTETVLDTDAQHLLAVVKALEKDVAWHSPARFQVAANIARELLTGPQADANERLLQEEGEDWNELYLDTLYADEGRRAYLQRGTTSYDWSGRGGGAVWRAERQVSLGNFGDWLTSHIRTDTADYVVRPPGWVLSRPPGWHAVAPDPTHRPAAATVRDMDGRGPRPGLSLPRQTGRVATPAPTQPAGLRSRARRRGTPRSRDRPEARAGPQLHRGPARRLEPPVRRRRRPRPPPGPGRPRGPGVRLRPHQRRGTPTRHGRGARGNSEQHG